MDGAEVLESDVRFYLRCPIRTASGVAKEKQGRRTGKSCHTSSAVAQFRLTSFLFCLRTSKKNPFPPSGAKRWNGFKLTQITQNARQHRPGRWFEVCRSSGCFFFVLFFYRGGSIFFLIFWQRGTFLYSPPHDFALCGRKQKREFGVFFSWGAAIVFWPVGRQLFNYIVMDCFWSNCTVTVTQTEPGLCAKEVETERQRRQRGFPHVKSEWGYRRVVEK